MKYLRGVLLFLAVFFVAAMVLARPAFAVRIPAPAGFVNDFAGVLTPEQKQALETSLTDYEKTSGNEIAVALIKSLEGDTIENVAVTVFEEWKIGKKGKDNGILFLAAIDDRKMRIEVGYGLEPLLTDAEAGDIIRSVIAPEFKTGNYAAGVTRGVAAIEGQLSGDPSENIPKSAPSSNGGGLYIWIGIFLFFLLQSVFVYFCAFLARSKSIWLGGIVGAVIGLVVGVFVATAIAGLVSAGILGGLGVLLDWHLSRRYTILKKAGKPTDWWSSGGGFWGGRGGSSGGSSGGFGGGSSGGGGSGGGW